MSGEPLTFIERARREQLVAVTIGLIAEIGYARCSLQRIADAAGLTKGAVLYHFRSKDALVAAAYAQVMTAMTEHVGTQVEAAATPGAAVEAYVTGMVGHLADHPEHLRMIVVGLDEKGAGIRDRTDRPARWAPLAELVAAAQAAGQLRPGDPRTVAIVVGGAIDGVIAEFLDDPAFDLRAAAGVLLDVLRGGWSP